LSLYRVGVDVRGELLLNVQLEQRIWTGNLGVYWGYRPVAEPAGWYQFEYLQIMPLAQGGFRLRIVRTEVDPTAPHISKSVELAYKDIGPVDAGTHTLGFEIRQGNLVRLHWDNIDLQPLVQQRDAIAPGDPISGTFGLISVGGHGKFSRLQIDHRNTPFDNSMHVELP
jgi:hypothetical protein